MSTNVNTFVPDRDELRALYDEAIAELNPDREKQTYNPILPANVECRL